MKLPVASLAFLAPLASACLLPGETDPDFQLVKRQNAGTGTPIGQGDRFADGTVPRGLGSLPAGSNFTTILNTHEVVSGLLALEAEYDNIEVFELPYETFEGRKVYGAKVGGQGSCTDAFRVFFNGNIHARERGAADNILYFVADLLYADKHNTGLTYGGMIYSSCEVKRALSAGIVVVPLSNPDGVYWDQTTDTCWRKNRNTTFATGSAASVGVDLNRNFDVVWDNANKFHPDVALQVASYEPRSQVYHGGSAFSEAETRNVKHVMDTFSKVSWYIDLHSFAGDVLYSWGLDTNQARHPNMSFLNPEYDDMRGIIPDSPGEGIVYGEYTPDKDWMESSFAGAKMATAMDQAVGLERHYETMPAASLYPTSGASDDYAYSRHFADPSLTNIHAYTVEFGFGNDDFSCPFYPTVAEYNYHILEMASGFLQWVLTAESIGLGDPVSCPS